MIGITEIIFSGIIFCVIWFLIFKFKLIYDEKSKLRNINARLEKQDLKAPELLAELKEHSDSRNKQLEEQKEKEEAKKQKKEDKKPGFFKRFSKKKGVKKE